MTSGIFIEWWLRTESNRRHEDFQSSALPTELQSQICIAILVLPLNSSAEVNLTQSNL